MGKTKLLLPLLMAIVMMAMSPQKMWALDQDTDGYYKIYNATDLADFRTIVNGSNSAACAKLMNNISFSETDIWTPMGVNGHTYSGTFDGQNHSISGMSMNVTGWEEGLFGWIQGATIQNLTVSGTMASTTTNGSCRESIGGVVGLARGVNTITNVHSNVNITMNHNNFMGVGGVVGKVEYISGYSTIKNCSYSGTLTLNSNIGRVGGIVGNVSNGGTVTNCSFTGTITTASGCESIGGIIGWIYNDNSAVSISNCTNTGAMTLGTGPEIGGIIGHAAGNLNILNNTFASGATLNTATSSTACKFVGGIAGKTDGTILIQECTAAGSINVDESYDCIAGIVGYCNDNSKLTIKSCLYSGHISNTSTNSDINRVAGIIAYASDNGNNFGGIKGCLCCGSFSTPSSNTIKPGAIASALYNNALDRMTDNYYRSDMATAVVFHYSGGHSIASSNNSRTADQISNGQVAYELYNGSIDGHTSWRQNIGTDNNPVLDQTHGMVYRNNHNNCSGTFVEYIYTNNNQNVTDAHDYTSQTVSNIYKKSDATCTAAAVYYYSCSKCNANENNANHTFTNGSAIGHGSTGYTETYSWSGTCYNDASKDTKACSFTLKCNKCSTNVVNGSSLTCSKTAHTDATCLAAGKTTYSATGSYTSTNSSYNYSATKTHDYTIAALGHGSTGYTETYTWSGTCYNDASQDTKACTFTLKCKMCSTNVVEGTSLTCTKKAHTDATCTKTGSTTYCATGSYTSANVSYNYSATKTNDYTVAAIGHKYTTYTYNNDVTCGKAGTKTASCDNGCGTTDTKDDPEHPATGSHEFTENSNGFCTGCGIYQPATLVNSVYEIGNAGQLYWFANQANTVNLGIHGKLTKDITVNDGTFDENGKFTKTGETVESTPISWTPIGSNSYSPYTGTFDGNNHSISGLYCSRPTRGYVGFFGCAKGATITDLGIIKSYFCGYLNVGAVCGSIYSTNANITNCFSADGFIRGSYNGENSGGIGGLVGLCGNGNPTISNCHSSCTVISDCEKTGGLCGWNSGTLVGCYATGNVTGTLYRVGGICGYNKGGIIKRSWFSGNVSDAKGAVAGICGELGSGTIENCFVTGNVIDISTTTSQYETDYGGIVAWIVDGNVTNCYFTGNITCVNKTDQTLIGGICGCEDEGYISNCYTNYNIGVGGYSGTINNVNANVPLARFQSGEIAYLLNGSRNEDTEESPLVWGQVLEADTTPTLNGHGVHSYKRTNIKNKWGTLVVPFDVLADQEEYDLYSIIRVEDEELALERPEGILPAGTPVLVRMSEAGKDAETGKYNLILKAANTTLNTSGTLTSEIVEGLTLKGSYDVKDITKVSGYIISNNAFWNIQTIKGENKIYNAPFRAYLEGSTANCAKMLSIGWNDDEDITAVETLDALTSDEAQYFDINGRRLNDLQQGINIVKRGNKTYKIIVK